MTEHEGIRWLDEKAFERVEQNCAQSPKPSKQLIGLFKNRPKPIAIVANARESQ